MNKKEILNINVLNEYAGTPEDVLFFADVFIRQTARDLAELAMAGVEQDGKRWVDICHKIKGAASMAGAHVLCDLCDQGESMQTATPDDKDAFCKRMSQAFDDVCAAFAREAAVKRA